MARYTAAAEIEADILRKLNRKDYRRESGCVCLLDAFMYHQRHMCLVFECLGKSLYDVLAENKYRGFYLQDIVEVARQGLNTLAFMRDCKLAHTDLKVLSPSLCMQPPPTSTPPEAAVAAAVAAAAALSACMHECMHAWVLLLGSQGELCCRLLGFWGYGMFSCSSEH